MEEKIIKIQEISNFYKKDLVDISYDKKLVILEHKTDKNQDNGWYCENESLILSEDSFKVAFGIKGEIQKITYDKINDNVIIITK